jgi:hypothetical protein
MDLDLQRIRDLTAKSQWSVDDLDWKKPIDVADISPRARHEAGLALLFTAGLEREAAYVFELCARHVDDPVAKEIYELFRQDELRHAEAEVRLARRYGVEWADLPLGVRAMCGAFEKGREKEPDPRRAYEFASAYILLFELALDTILIPALKKLSNDPIQAEVFRRIDNDESRHLAMDYWLLERRGQQARANPAPERKPMSERLLSKLPLAYTLTLLVLGFGSMAFHVRALRGTLLDEASLEKYLELVEKVPKKAPHALDVHAYRVGLAGQGHIVKLLSLFDDQAKSA